jgi:N4-gp56 family major capsid protein
MATTNYPVGHPLAPRLWRKKLAVEALRKTFFSDLLGTSADSVFQQLDDLTKGGGDRVTYGLRGQLTGRGVTGDGTLEGNEEALSTYSDTLIIDQLRHAVRSAGKMSEQRILFNVREESKSGLADWFAERWDISAFNHLCGFTAQTDLAYTGNNATIAPDAAHIYRPNSKTADEALTTGDEFSLNIVDVMVARAAQFTTSANTGVPIQKADFSGRKMWIMFLHDYQAYQLRTTAAAGSWIDYQKALTSGSYAADTSLFKGGNLIGEYNGVLMVKAPRITNGVNSTTGAAVTNARRAVLVGAQAGLFAMGRQQGSSEGDKFSWVEETFDYGNQLGVSAGSIFGMKKTRFTPAGSGPTSDFATFVASTYSPAP